MEGSAEPGEEREPRGFALSLLLAQLSAVLFGRLQGGHGLPLSERLGGVFLWFSFICMFARVIFSLPVSLQTDRGKATLGTIKHLPVREASIGSSATLSPEVAARPALFVRPPRTALVA